MKCLWLYPANGDNPPLKNGTEIIAEFDYYGNLRILHLKRMSGYWAAQYTSQGRSSYADDDIDILAWMPYVKSNPPQKPQNCPFCGGEMRYKCAIYDYWFACENESCGLVSPERQTKEEAIKALNSIKVEKAIIAKKQ